MKTTYQKPPPVPVRPEPMDQLQRRFPAALEEIFDEESCALGSTLRLGEKPANVFDTEDGIRIIANRVRMARGGQIITQWSASVRVDSDMERWAMAIPEDQRCGPVLGRLVTVYANLSGSDDVRCHRLVLITKCGVAHFVVIE